MEITDRPEDLFLKGGTQLRSKAFAPGLLRKIFIRFKPESLSGVRIFDSYQIDPSEEYEVLGVTGSELLVQVGKDMLNVYPKHLIITRVENLQLDLVVDE